MGFYPTYEEANLGEPVPRSVLLSIMKAAAAADPIDQAEIKARHYEGMIAGEQLKVLAAIAQSGEGQKLTRRRRKPESNFWSLKSIQLGGVNARRHGGAYPSCLFFDAHLA
jgi:hypothetical protein